MGWLMDAFMSREGEVHTETQLVTYKRHIQRNVGEAESKDRVCSQVLLSLNTEHQFTAFLISIWTHNNHRRNIYASFLSGFCPSQPVCSRQSACPRDPQSTMDMVLTPQV